ncbi:MAG: acyl-CoA thioesterase [Bacteroidota bacterium]
MKFSFSHQVLLRIRYSETDQMGFCYYGNYPVFLELGRVEALRSLGVSYRELEDQGILLPVTSLHIEYKKPLRYDEQFKVTTKLTAFSSCSVTFDYELLNLNDQITTIASTVLVFTDARSLKPIRIPKSLMDALKTYEIN